MALPPVNWSALIAKYGSERMPHDVRMDMMTLMAYAKQLLADNIELAKAVKGAKQTMIAFTRACGSLELPYETVLSVTESDDLVVEDIKRGDACFKRFSYVNRAATN
jgi:hypothetical protein